MTFNYKLEPWFWSDFFFKIRFKTNSESENRLCHSNWFINLNAKFFFKITISRKLFPFQLSKVPFYLAMWLFQNNLKNRLISDTINDFEKCHLFIFRIHEKGARYTMYYQFIAGDKMKVCRCWFFVHSVYSWFAVFVTNWTLFIVDRM